MPSGNDNPPINPQTNPQTNISTNVTHPTLGAIRTSNGVTQLFSGQHIQFTHEQSERIQRELDKPVEIEHIQFRPSPQGSVAYVEGWKALSLANEVFGFNGWSSEVLSLSTDFVDVEDGRISIGVSCLVRVHLRDGTFHDVRGKRIPVY